MDGPVNNTKFNIYYKKKSRNAENYGSCQQNLPIVLQLAGFSSEQKLV